MIRSIMPLLLSAPVAFAATAPAQTTIPSRMVKVVEFDDQARTYRVDLESGKVTYTDASNVIPPAPVPPKPPEPPAPKPPTPPKPDLDGLALRVNQWFLAKVTSDTARTAAELAQAIDTAIAVSGGLGYKGQQVLDELRKQIDYKGLAPRLKGFPLGDAIKSYVDDDPDKIMPALRQAKAGLEAIK